MYKKTKTEKELESYINNQPLKSIDQKEILLNNKRERGNEVKISKAPHNNINPTNSTSIEQKAVLSSKELFEKLFSIANKQQSLMKCVKLIKLALIKIYNDTKSLNDIIGLLYRIDRLTFKVNDIVNDKDTYKEIYEYVNNEIVLKHKNDKFNVNNKDKEDVEKVDDNANEEYALNIIKTFEISFVLISELFTDDSFAFNAAIKKINDSIVSLPDCSSDEKDIESIIFDIKDSSEALLKDSNRALNIVSLRRTLLFDCFESMLYSKSQMKTSIIQSYSKLMINKSKLNQKQQKRLNELIKEIKENSKTANIKMNIINSLDSKTKSNPLEPYYQINDSREEKYVMSNFSKWESKQNGTDSTKLYFG